MYRIKNVHFEEVDFVSGCNEWMVLKVCFSVDENDVEEKMIVHNNGKYHFHGGNTLEHMKKTNSEILTERTKDMFKRTKEYIMDEANLWCEDFGFPKLVEEI